MKDKFIFYEVSQNIRQRLIAWLGRPYILSYEWIYLKNHAFPFDIPQRKLLAFFSRIEIKDLDVSPLVSILECGFQAPDIAMKEAMEEYAWMIVMDSVSCVWGG